jgi:uncharacterized protein (TIGR03546 family)
MFLLKQIIKLIRLLHADEGSFALALGFSLSLFPAFSGFASILGLFSLLIVIIFRVQMGAYFLGYFLFSLISLPFLPYFHELGLKVLTLENLNSFFTIFSNSPAMHWLKFNHTQVLGGQLIALFLFPVSLVGFKILIDKYKATVVQRVKETKFYKYFTKTSAFLNYNNILESLKSN